MTSRDRVTLHVQDLVHGVCTNPACRDEEHPIRIVASCHPAAGVDLSFDRNNRALAVLCHECKTPICDVAVAVGTTH